MHDVFIHNAVIHDGERFTDADALLVNPKSRTGWLYNQPAPYFLRLAAR